MLDFYPGVVKLVVVVGMVMFSVDFFNYNNSFVMALRFHGVRRTAAMLTSNVTLIFS